MVIVPASSGLSARRAASELESLLVERTGQTIEVVLAGRYAEALAALCDSAGGTVSLAWLDGISYAAAEAQGCGTPLFQIERRVGRANQAGEPVVLVANAESDIENIADLADRATLCRIGYDDLSTWLISGILLRAGGVDVVSDIGNIVDYEDTALLLEAVASGECDAAGVPESAYEDAGSDIREALVRLDESPAIPYSILVVPREMPLGLQMSIEEAIAAMSSDEQSADVLDDLLDFDRLASVEANDLASVRRFVADAGLDLAVLGS